MESKMGLLRRQPMLALAAGLALLIAFARYGGGSRLSPTPPPAVVAPSPPPPPPPAVPAKPKRTARKTIALKPPAPAKIRGEKLREKGEAFGGTAPERVETTTATLH